MLKYVIPNNNFNILRKMHLGTVLWNVSDILVVSWMSWW